jgi:uncharacterized membrane protein YGL010W
MMFSSNDLAWNRVQRFFDKFCVGMPVLVIGFIVQFIADKLQGKRPDKKTKAVKAD